MKRFYNHFIANTLLELTKMIIYLSVIGYLAYKLIHYLKLDFTKLDSAEINYLVALGTVAIALFAYHELNKSNKQETILYTIFQIDGEAMKQLKHAK